MARSSLTYIPFLAHLALRPCELLHHFSSVVRPSTFHIFSPETTGPIATKLWWNCPLMVPFQNCVRWCRLPSKMAAKLKIEKRGNEILKKIFSDETIEPISTKLCWNDPWVVPFQYCVQHFRPPTKMAATAELNLTWISEIAIKIFLSENISSIRTKFWWNSHWMVLYQKCVRRFGPSTKMAPTAELSLT